MISLVLALSGACAQKDELGDGVPASAPVQSGNLQEALMAFGPPWP